MLLQSSVQTKPTPGYNADGEIYGNIVYVHYEVSTQNTDSTPVVICQREYSRLHCVGTKSTILV